MAVCALTTDQDDEWRDWIGELPSHLRDVHWHPDFYKAYELIYGDKGYLVVSREGSQSAAIPILRRGDQALHVHNFGGPIGSPCVGVAWDIVDWKRKEGIKHERCVLHPLFHKEQKAILAKAPGASEYVKDAVYIDLTKPYELRTTHRQMLRVAREAGVTVSKVATDSANLADFHRMYSESMERKGAAEHWKVPDTYFQVLAECLGDRLSMFFGYMGDELESGCVVLHDNDTAYYHYAASVGKHARSGIGVSLVVACADWARAARYKRLFLGGGVEPEDGLFRFKAGFSKERVPVHRYQVTHDCI